MQRLPMNRTHLVQHRRLHGSLRVRCARRFGFLCLGLVSFGLAGCADSGLSAVSVPGTAFASLFPDSAKAGPHRLSVFVVSRRKGERGDASEEAGDKTRFSLQGITVPPSHQAGQVERPTLGDEDPNRDIVLAGRRSLAEDEFLHTIAMHLSGRIGSNRDILIYVHGFNTSYDDARYRLAQIVEDGRFGGVPVLFTWPSANNLLDYGAAKENATISRDSLTRLIQQVGALPDVGRVHILAHSMGTWLAMEALRENAIGGSPDLNGRLGDVMLAAPDIDLNVFKQQMARLDPSHFVVIVTANDRALSLSRTLAGDRPRLGALDPHKPEDHAALDALGVKVVDLSSESMDLLHHGNYASVPVAVRNMGAELGKSRVEDANVQAVLGERPIDNTIASTPLAPVGANVAPTPTSQPAASIPAAQGGASAPGGSTPAPSAQTDVTAPAGAAQAQ
ncbi:alpha/beta fold hydrolase [Beijerinckia mobilis]|uniref:alpha/beta fold hydrolase n=1 Tax=Beijerinckia mobilis TaxID=231434 RepID=UPI001FD8E530|nr:alpha/beta fold hydrolase [Beijerinckia mobilis]